MAKCQSLFSGGCFIHMGCLCPCFRAVLFIVKKKAAPHEAAFSPQRNPVPSHPLCPMSSVSAWSTAAAVPKYDGARHTRVSRHFCIGGADLESWVHCVVHIFYPFGPNWMEGNKGIPAYPKYPPLPDLGLAGKPVPSELLYKLVPSTYIIEKIACM